MEWWKFLVLILGSYLLGNVFTARIISKIKHFDFSKSGSGNPGTMNMLRNLGLGVGLLTLFFDMIKGIIPALVGFYLFGGTNGGTNAYIGLYTGGLSALVGTIFPVFYRFNGGKGVALVYGMFAVASPIMAIFVFLGGIVYLLIFDYASLLSFTVLTVFTIYEAYSLGLMSGQGNIVLSILLFAIFFLVWFAHRQNIFRLLVGRENRVNFKGKLLGRKKLSKDQKEALKNKEIG